MQFPRLLDFDVSFARSMRVLLMRMAGAQAFGTLSLTLVSFCLLFLRCNVGYHFVLAWEYAYFCGYLHLYISNAYESEL
jgi:hypothetical protein